MLTSLRSAHPTESAEITSTGGWIAQRVMILAAAVVMFAPFVLVYAGQ